jgi:hypothetical protein
MHYKCNILSYKMYNIISYKLTSSILMRLFFW